MDYGKLINRAFEIAWKYKILWIFGLFTGMGSSNFNWSDNSRGNSEWLRDITDQLSGGNRSFDIPSDMALPLAGGLLAAMLLVGLIFLIANRIATPALIDSVNNIERGGHFRFSDSFSRGVDLFWRFVGLFFVELFAWIASLVIILPVCIILAITIIGIPVAIALFFFYVYFWFTYFSLAERAITVRDSTIGDSLSEAWILIKTHFKRTLVMGLISLGLSIVMAIASFIILLIIALPFGGTAWMMTDSPVAGFLIGFLFAFPVALVIGGFTSTVVSSMYTLFYFELVEPGGPYNRKIGQTAEPTGSSSAPSGPVSPITPTDPPPTTDSPPPDHQPPDRPEP